MIEDVITPGLRIQLKVTHSAVTGNREKADPSGDSEQKTLYFVSHLNNYFCEDMV